ncbi:MAG: hypothetical protein LAP38_15740 [Acidobacteriia bacterium]|nr:hypothetical protein [Terriglobia bacterium]
MAVDVTTGSAFKAIPQRLFDAPFRGAGGNYVLVWDVAADGKKFLILTQESDATPLTVELNWEAGLKK